MTYSVGFRRKILAIKEKEDLSYAEAPKRFDISKAALFRWSKKIEPQKNRNKKAVKIDMEALKNDIELYPDSYCYERTVRLGASSTGIRDAIYRLGVTYKKTLNHPKADLEKRSMFCQEIQKLKNEGKTIVYIDESGFAHDMPRTHGYSDKGKRCYGSHNW